MLILRLITAQPAKIKCVNSDELYYKKLERCIKTFHIIIIIISVSKAILLKQFISRVVFDWQLLLL